MTAPSLVSSTQVINSSVTTDPVLLVPKPASLAVGDLLLVIIWNQSAVATLGSDTIPSGWNTSVSQKSVTGSDEYKTILYWKIATSTETAASTFSFTRGTFGVNSLAAVGLCARLTGHNATTPLGVTPTISVSVDNSATLTFAAITTATTDNLIIYMGSANELGTTNGSSWPTIGPSGTTVSTGAKINDGSLMAGMAYVSQATAATVASTSIAVNVHNRGAHIGFTVAVAPSAGTTYNQSVSITTTPTPSLVRSPGKKLSITSTPIPRIIRAVGKPRSITSTPVPVIIRQTTKTLAIASTPVPSMLAPKVRLAIISIVTTAVPAIVRSPGKVISILTTPTPSLARAMAKALSIVSTPVPVIRRALARAISIVSTPVPKAVRSVAKSLVIDTAPVPAVVRSARKPLSISTVPIPLIVRIVGRILTITTTPVPSRVALKVKLITLSVTTTPVASLRRSIGKLLNAVANALARLSTSGGSTGPVAAYPWRPPAFYVPPYGFGPVGMFEYPIWDDQLRPSTTWTAGTRPATTWSTPERNQTTWRS